MSRGCLSVGIPHELSNATSSDAAISNREVRWIFIRGARRNWAIGQ